MDLRSGQAFWPIKNGLLGVYPALDQDLNCEVLVIGGGITGALVAYHLVQAGLDTVLLDKRDVAHGSTSASTALLQYEIDTHLVDLSRMIGEADAGRAYLLCLAAIEKLETIAHRLGDSCTFARKHSLYFASRPKDAGILKEEYQARRKLGIEVELLEAGEIQERFGFCKSAALYSAAGAEVDVYRLTHQLLCEANKQGLRVYDRSRVTQWARSQGRFVVQTEREHTVQARRMVFATGYEAQEYLVQPLAALKNTYALVSEPLTLDNQGLCESLIWETARPYLYIRTTSDNRVIVGGEDESYRTLPLRERRIPHKQKRLEQRFAQLFANIKLETAYAWAGTFGETKDGLAYIGESPELPGAYFALGYGGNGITYSVIAAEMVRDLCLGRPNPDQHIFRFER